MTDPIAEIEDLLAERGFNLSDHPEIAVAIWQAEPWLKAAGIPSSVLVETMRFVADMP